MLDPKASVRALRHLFRRHPVADLGTLCAALDTESRMSVFRRLKQLGYISSITHRGRFYTLENIPHFDEDGLWSIDGVVFSAHRTLKETLVQLVISADAGRTHEELADRLQVRVHNTLLEIVEAKRIARRRLEAIYLYVNKDPRLAQLQLDRRLELGTAARAVYVAPELVIAILLDVIKSGKARVNAKQIAARLRRQQFEVTVSTVELVLTRHGIQKKTAR